MVNDRIDHFKTDLSHNRETGFMVRKYVIMGDCYKLNLDQYIDLKGEVAEHFKINPNEVVLVGSAKLGFSIAPKKRYTPFNEDKSDLDIAIISPQLFDRIWFQVFRYWSDGNRWPEWDQFTSYLFRGWIRPDKLPPSRRFEIRDDWWGYFKSLSQQGKYGPYDMAAGLYKDWGFFEAYQSICIEKCKRIRG